MVCIDGGVAYKDWEKVSFQVTVNCTSEQPADMPCLLVSVLI